MDRLCFTARCAVLAVLGLVASGAAAQVPDGGTWTVAEAFPPGTVLYEAADIGPVQAVAALYRVGADGTTAAVLPSHACAPRCMVFSVRVTAAAGRLTPVASHAPGGWIVALTRTGSRVEVNGVLVAQANARLHVPPGSHDLTFRFENGEVRTQSLTVPVNTEITVAQLPTRNAPPATAPALAAAATIPPGLLAGLLAGAESNPDAPATGWRLPEPRPSPETASPHPSPPVIEAATPPQLSLPSAEAPPVAATPAPSADLQAGPACDGTGEDLSETVLRQTRRAEYPDARACLLRLAAESGSQASVLARLSALDWALVQEAGLGDASRQYLASLRLQAASAAERGAAAPLLAAASEILSIVPGDPSAVVYLREFAQSVRPPDGRPEATFAFVPGVHALQAAGHLVPAGVPETGFLLTTGEVSNAQFVVFLNQSQEVDRSFLVRRPAFIERTRQGTWQSKEGAAGLPVVDATWHGAAAYAAWAGGRLPTSAEWVWAYQRGAASARGVVPNLNTGSATPGLVGATVGTPDGIGLVHMLGNAWEWLASDEARPTQVIVAGGSYTTRPDVLVERITQGTSPETPRGHVSFRVFRPLLP